MERQMADGMLRPMPDPDAVPPDSAPAPTPTLAHAPIRPYLPLAAYPTPARPALAPPAAAPTWTRAYELPSARRVVSAGLQLSVDASAPIRRASIYIGLLALGAFGPAVVLLLLGISKVLSVPGITDAFTDDPSTFFTSQPELIGPALLVYVLVLVGFMLLLAISVDAQAIAISILAGRASDRPMRHFEAVTRARQVFWRLTGAGFLAGLGSLVIQLIVTTLFSRPDDANTGISFIALAIGTFVITPLAFASTGIVLGDVGAVEALRRSVALFRARKRIALTVTLFTLVASAIQSFALGAGVDLAVRVGDAMHLELDVGGIGLIVIAAIVLAVVMAFGSLTFTIAAIVAAPQVAAFLGMTYYAAGLDRARSPDGLRPKRFRWVSAPMTLTMTGMFVATIVGVPAVTELHPPPPSALVTVLNGSADARAERVTATGPSRITTDAVGDQGVLDRPGSDIVSAGYGFLPEVPAWFLNGFFACSEPAVTCSPGGSNPQAFYAEGALLFVERLAAAPLTTGTSRREWGPVLALDGARTAPAGINSLFPNASEAIITRYEGDIARISVLRYFASGFIEQSTDARSMRTGVDVVTLVPVRELSAWPVAWDMHAFESGSTASGNARDMLRSTLGAPLLAFEDPPTFTFVPVAQP
jgi:hypothetical protein